MFRSQLIPFILASLVCCACSESATQPPLEATRAQLSEGLIPVVTQQRTQFVEDWPGQFSPPDNTLKFLVGYYDPNGHTVQWTDAFADQLDLLVQEVELPSVRLHMVGLIPAPNDWLAAGWRTLTTPDQMAFDVGEMVVGDTFFGSIRDEQQSQSFGLNVFELAGVDELIYLPDGHILTSRTVYQTPSQTCCSYANGWCYTYECFAASPFGGDLD